MIASVLDLVAKVLVIGALVYASVVALGYWGVRTKRLNRFGPVARGVRRIGDPVLTRLERRVVRAGGNPQDAPLWLLAIVIIGGVIAISLLRWLIGTAYQLSALSRADPQVWIYQLVNWTFSVLMFALLVRVIASWFGASPYSWWMRPVMALTSWIIDPIRRFLPPFGVLDLSPLVAYFLLWVARQALLQALH